ncbi:MAG TPA: SPOR domain-containing protein [Candidatus Cloacimonas acidaminovorans]|nr:SPOR domain-containing protein [Candidatus Cloacimonas acidaminovorans]
MLKSPFPAVKQVFLFILLTGLCCFAFAAVRKEFQDLDKLYNSGKLDELSANISTLKPVNDEERACLGFYNALLKVKIEDAISAHQWLIEKFPKSPYAQKSLLELGKIFILDRKIEEATLYLRRITSPEIIERFYWLGLCAWWNDDYANAISNCENYLRLAPRGEFAEKSYYLIAECYLEQKKAYSAVATLLKLQNAKLPEMDEQYFYYRLGYAYELSDKPIDAITAYRKGYEQDPYSQVAYQIEDRILELKSSKPNIDISFLYPYSPLQVTIVQEEQPDTLKTSVTTDSKSSSSSTAKQIEVKQDTPVKLKEKPKEGYWLQAGRFSVESNANRLVINIRLLNIPAAYYEDVSGGKKSWVVVCGSFPDRAKAEEAKELLATKNINSFITAY